MNQKTFNEKAKSANSTATPTLAARYRSYFSLVPGLLKLIGDGVLTSKVSSSDGTVNDGVKTEPLVRSATDFSYSADRYAGNGYRLIGDAGGEFCIILVSIFDRVADAFSLSHSIY